MGEKSPMSRMSNSNFFTRVFFWPIMAQERVTLHVELQCSPIYLLFYCFLQTKKWKRWKVVSASLVVSHTPPCPRPFSSSSLFFSPPPFLLLSHSFLPCLFFFFSDWRWRCGGDGSGWRVNVDGGFESEEGEAVVGKRWREWGMRWRWGL